MKKAVAVILALLLLTACGGIGKSNSVLEPHKNHIITEAYNDLMLQIDLSREVWARGYNTYSTEQLEKLGECGQRAVAVAENINSTDEECDSIRLELKSVTAEVKTSVASRSSIRELGELIEKAEKEITNANSDRKATLSEAIKEAYAVYSSSSSTTEIKKATQNLKKILK